MTIACKKCGIVNGFIEEEGSQTGLYCNKCGKWIKWLSKDETRLFKHTNLHDKEIIDKTMDTIKKSIKNIYVGTMFETKEECNAFHWTQDKCLEIIEELKAGGKNDD